MPMVFAASTTSVPAGTAILWPSIVRLTSGIGPTHEWGGGIEGHLAHVAHMPQRVVLVLLAEVAERRVDHPAARVTQAAKAAAILQAVRDPLQDVELDLRALVGQDALVGPHCPVLADAAWCALAARLVGVELQQPVRGLDDAMRVVHHDHAA